MGTGVTMCYPQCTKHLAWPTVRVRHMIMVRASKELMQMPDDMDELNEVQDEVGSFSADDLHFLV